MTNLEKYAEEIKNYKGTYFCGDFIRPIILKKEYCSVISCEQCIMMRMIWANEEYTEPEVDWNKVEVDTPILIKDCEQESWRRRYFAKFKDGRVYAWASGTTSWSASGEHDICSWKYAKLAEEDDE